MGTLVILISLSSLGHSMINLDAILGHLIDSGLVQYPDTRLYNAAAALKPEERPKTPVRLTGKDWKKPYLELGGNPMMGQYNTPRAFSNGRIVYVNDGNKDYKNPAKLSGILAHEAYHNEKGNNPGNPEEHGAIQREIGVLKRFKGMGRFINEMKEFHGIR